jgi:hypothetical protein
MLTIKIDFEAEKSKMSALLKNWHVKGLGGRCLSV